jgi:hypothetical protein
MPALEERIARMERSLRRQRIATAMTLAVAVVAVAFAALARRERGAVRAESFELVNGGGDLLAQLGPAPTGGAFLKLAAPPQNGGSVVVGSVAEDLAGLAIVSRNEIALHASTDPDGNPSISLSQKGRKAMISVRGDAPPTLLMVGNPGLFAATTRHVWLKDPSGKTLLSTGGGPPEEAR